MHRMFEIRTRQLMAAKVTDQKAIGRRLRAARRVVKLRQKDLAEICGTVPTAVVNWESGTRRLGLSHAAMLLPRLGVTLDWLYLADDRGLSWDQREALAAALAKDDFPAEGDIAG